MDLSFTLFGQPFSVVETIAALLGLAYIIFEYRANVWLWVFSIAMSALYVGVYLSQHMYANMVLSIYNIAVSVYGICAWKKGGSSKDEAPIVRFPLRRLPLLVGAIALLVPLLAWVLWSMGETSAPWLDGLTASLSVAGMWMLAKKYCEQWLCWIVADMLYVAMFVQESMWPSAVLYAVYVSIALFGYAKWRRESAAQVAR